jgi:hypothetical protein
MPKPTQAMREEADRGLAWRREHGRGGTEVGIARARDISNNQNLSMDTVQRMASYFARHAVDKEAEVGDLGKRGTPATGGSPGPSGAATPVKPGQTTFLTRKENEQ